MIRHLIFDMGNVLLSFDPRQAVCDVLGDCPELEAVVCATTLSPEWKLLDKGTISEQDAILAMCARTPEYTGQIRCFMEKWDQYLRPVPGMLELVQELKQLPCTLHLLSNAGLRFEQYSRRFPVFSLFDTIDISANFRLLKPQPEIYLAILKKHGLTASDCLFIDDLSENVEGARQIGIHAVQFTGEAELRSNLQDRGILSEDD